MSECVGCDAIESHRAQRARKAAEDAAVAIVARVMRGETPQRIWRDLCLKHRESVMDRVEGLR